MISHPLDRPPAFPLAPQKDENFLTVNDYASEIWFEIGATPISSKDSKAIKDAGGSFRSIKPSDTAREVRLPVRPSALLLAVGLVERYGDGYRLSRIHKVRLRFAGGPNIQKQGPNLETITAPALWQDAPYSYLLRETQPTIKREYMLPVKDFGTHLSNACTSYADDCYRYLTAYREYCERCLAKHIAQEDKWADGWADKIFEANKAYDEIVAAHTPPASESRLGIPAPTIQMPMREDFLARYLGLQNLCPDHHSRGAKIFDVSEPHSPKWVDRPSTT